MSDEAALLNAILANPGDDTARLVYADWLEEHDQPLRADFIRTQVRIAACSAADPEYPDLLEHYAGVIARFGPNQEFAVPELPPAFAFADDKIGIASYSRGFISSVRGAWANEKRPPTPDEITQFASGLQQLVATLPTRHLDLYGLEPDDLARILAAPGAEKLTGLVLSQAITAFITRSADRTLQALASSKITAGLEMLFLAFHTNQPATAGFTALAKAKFDRLTQLGLWVQTGPACDLTPLTKAKWFRNLRSVYFSDSAARGSAFVPALATLPHLRSLDLLQQSTQARQAFRSASGFPALARIHLMGRTPFNDAVAMAKGKFPRLAELAIRGEGDADEALLRFCDAKWWPQIRLLELAGGWITDESVKSLARSPVASNLRILRMHQRAFGKPGLAALADGTLFPNLTTLELDLSSTSKCASTAITAFLKQLTLPRLYQLSLDGYPLDDDGANALAKNPALANLTRLSLRNCGIGDRGLTAIANSPHLRQLMELDLVSNKLKTASALRDRTLLPRLTLPRLEYNSLSPIAMQKLYASRS